jgi:hypothetical protein
MDLLEVILLHLVELVVVQDSLKVEVETLVLVVELVMETTEVYQDHNYLRQSVPKHKDMKVALHIILIKEVAAVAALVVLAIMVDQVELVMVDQELLLL